MSWVWYEASCQLVVFYFLDEHLHDDRVATVAVRAVCWRLLAHDKGVTACCEMN